MPILSTISFLIYPTQNSTFRLICLKILQFLACQVWYTIAPIIIVATSFLNCFQCLLLVHCIISGIAMFGKLIVAHLVRASLMFLTQQQSPNRCCCVSITPSSHRQHSASPMIGMFSCISQLFVCIFCWYASHKTNLCLGSITLLHIKSISLHLDIYPSITL